MKMTDKTYQSNDETEADQPEGNPFDELISTLESYAKNPKLATPETLSQAAQMAKELKDAYESEDQDDGVESEDEPKKPGLMLMIQAGNGRKQSNA